MRDFLPLEKAERNSLLSQIIDSYRSFGFQEIETPALESIERLSSGMGGDNEKLAFRILKRGDELEQAIATSPGQLSDLGLRYDLTVPLTRFYASNRAKLPKVLKAIQVGPVWRAERPQKGRYRQFMQCDIDIIGEAGSLAEIEILNASLAALAKLGLDQVTVRVNHRGLLQAALQQLGIAKSDLAKAMITIDKLDKIELSGVVSELGATFSENIAKSVGSWLEANRESAIPAELQDLFNTLEPLYPGKLRYDPSLVRGMGYYTGVIFEIEHPKSGASIAGGGRYDGLIGRWLGEDVPAVGISLGFDRLFELVSEPAEQEQNLVLVFEPQQLATALEIQRAGIARGVAIRLEPKPKKLANLLESLKTQGFSSFAQIGQAKDFAGLEIKPIG